MFSCSLIVSSMQFRSWHECNTILPKQSPSLSLIQYSLLTQNVIYQYFQAFSLSLLFDFSLFLSLLAKLGSSLISAINLWDPHMLSYTCKHILSHGKMSVIVIKGVCSSRADETRLEMEFERYKRCTSIYQCKQVSTDQQEKWRESPRSVSILQHQRVLAIFSTNDHTTLMKRRNLHETKSGVTFLKGCGGCFMGVFQMYKASFILSSIFVPNN